MDISWHLSRGSLGYGVVPEPQISEFQQPNYKNLKFGRKSLQVSPNVHFLTPLARITRLWGRTGAPNMIDNFSMTFNEVWSSDLCRSLREDFSWHLEQITSLGSKHELGQEGGPNLKKCVATQKPYRRGVVRGLCRGCAGILEPSADYNRTLVIYFI